MRPTTALNDNVVDLNAFLHPGTVFKHPRDVVSDPSLSLSKKRAILASWASDASAIASCPSLRAPEGLKAPVNIDEILEALCALDEGPRNPRAGNRCACGRSNGALLPEAEETTMFDESLARIRTHRNNIHRYRRLLQTQLSDLERDFIERRMAYEQTALDALVAETFPMAFFLPKPPSSSSVGSKR